jgi:para-aminobenzoate synthetase component 1
MTATSLEIPYHPPSAACARLGAADVWGAGLVLLESTRQEATQGRYSYLAADPYRTLVGKDGRLEHDGLVSSGDPFGALGDLLERDRLPTTPGLPPFQGGAAGVFGYELAQHLEHVPLAREDPGGPDLALGFFDVVVAYDHDEERTWIVSNGRPETDEGARRRRAARRLAAFADRLAGPLPSLPPPPPARPVTCRPDFSRAEYERRVGRVIEHILAGDIFQANLSQRFCAPSTEPPFDVYRRLGRDNPAPFAAYVELGGLVVASASPERFLRLDGRRVETRPIKGTRPRGASEEADRVSAEALLASEKDRAENVMIVDLLRNDISRVCLDGSVEVPALCALESFATVHHLVSTVVGELRPDASAVDLLRATFPGGSITGAPKIRAMEILAELEPVRRGPYCGSIGWIGCDGGMDVNIAIRTLTFRDGEVSFHAGGGIVADSDPRAEYDETLDKARALLAAVGCELVPA